MRWNTPDDWAVSHKQAHPALVSESDFVAAQHIRVTREVTPGRTYRLAGILHCGLCARRMDSHWTHQRPGYRCRHGHNSATTPQSDRPRNAYVREDQILAHLPALVLRVTGAVGGMAVSRPPPATPSSTCVPAASR